MIMLQIMLTLCYCMETVIVFIHIRSSKTFGKFVISVCALCSRAQCFPFHSFDIAMHLRCFTLKLTWTLIVNVFFYSSTWYFWPNGIFQRWQFVSISQRRMRKTRCNLPGWDTQQNGYKLSQCAFINHN